jgi:hypothetical protein
MRNVRTRRPDTAADNWADALGRWREGEPQAEETARERVPMRETGADRLVVARKPGNAGGAKETGRPGSIDGQPRGNEGRTPARLSPVSNRSTAAGGARALHGRSR